MTRSPFGVVVSRMMPGPYFSRSSGRRSPRRRRRSRMRRSRSESVGFQPQQPERQADAREVLARPARTPGSAGSSVTSSSPRGVPALPRCRPGDRRATPAVARGRGTACERCRTRPRPRRAVSVRTSRFCWNHAVTAMIAPMPDEDDQHHHAEGDDDPAPAFRHHSSFRVGVQRTARSSASASSCRRDRCPAWPVLSQDDIPCEPVPDRRPSSRAGRARRGRGRLPIPGPAAPERSGGPSRAPGASPAQLGPRRACSARARPRRTSARACRCRAAQTLDEHRLGVLEATGAEQRCAALVPELAVARILLLQLANHPHRVVEAPLAVVEQEQRELRIRLHQALVRARLLRSSATRAPCRRRSPPCTPSAESAPTMPRRCSGRCPTIRPGVLARRIELQHPFVRVVGAARGAERRQDSPFDGGAVRGLDADHRRRARKCASGSCGRARTSASASSSARVMCRLKRRASSGGGGIMLMLGFVTLPR